MVEKLPQSPAEPRQAQLREERVSRRTLFAKLGVLLNAAVGIVVAVPLVRYLLGSVGTQNKYLRWTDIGDVQRFKDQETTLINFVNPFSSPWDGETEKIPAYVRRDGPKFTVFAINCAHLGCPVRWFPESGLFMCPCHGGVYYADGSRASGPPERGLFEYETKIIDGKLFINAGQIPTLSTPA